MVIFTFPPAIRRHARPCAATFRRLLQAHHNPSYPAPVIAGSDRGGQPGPDRANPCIYTASWRGFSQHGPASPQSNQFVHVTPPYGELGSWRPFDKLRTCFARAFLIAPAPAQFGNNPAPHSCIFTASWRGGQGAGQINHPRAGPFDKLRAGSPPALFTCQQGRERIGG